MNILLVTMSMDIGGAETHILELAKELKRRNHVVYVMSNGGKYVEELENYGIEHIWAPLHNKKISNMKKSYKIIFAQFLFCVMIKNMKTQEVFELSIQGKVVYTVRWGNRENKKKQ